MEVICVYDLWLDSEDMPIKPEVNSIYNVLIAENIDGDWYFKLEGIPSVQNGFVCWWGRDGFIPLNSFKEKELKKELSEIFSL